jgi:hypothetical protein
MKKENPLSCRAANSCLSQDKKQGQQEERDAAQGDIGELLNSTLLEATFLVILMNKFPFLFNLV